MIIGGALGCPTAQGRRINQISLAIRLCRSRELYHIESNLGLIELHMNPIWASDHDKSKFALGFNIGPN